MADLKQLIFATRNAHKVKEFTAILKSNMPGSSIPNIMGLDEINCTEEIPETANTIRGNALQKAQFVASRYGVSCFAEDTGLEIDCLDGAPGVDTAHYAGQQRDANDNMALVLQKMKGITDRSARFRTVIALVAGDEIHPFEGICEGEILDQKHGTGGFGYDPIFRPSGCQQSFAEMSDDLKNRMSHRAKATQKLLHYLANRVSNK